jgi:heat shock protein HslJ
MKSIIVLCAAFVLSAVAFPSGVFGAPAWDSGISFSDVEGKEWILSEVKSAGKSVIMDRAKLQASNMGGVYTITFNGEQVNGMGAPNRYLGPYTVGSNRALSIGNVASTMMMGLFQPDGLAENEFVAYLSKVTRWDFRDGKLELYSSNSDGTEAVLIFAPN